MRLRQRLAGSVKTKHRTNCELCLVTFVALMPADKIHADSCGNYYNGKGNDRDMVLGITQGMSAENGQDNSRKSADKTNKEPVRNGDIRKPYKVGEQIFWCSGNEEQEKENALHFFMIFEKGKFLQFLILNKEVQELLPETADEEKDDHTAKGGTDGTDQTSFYNAECITGGDLKRTTRNDGGKDL